jgi:hypothetical protein
MRYVQRKESIRIIYEIYTANLLYPSSAAHWRLSNIMQKVSVDSFLGAQVPEQRHSTANFQNIRDDQLRSLAPT